MTEWIKSDIQTTDKRGLGTQLRKGRREACGQVECLHHAIHQSSNRRAAHVIWCHALLLCRKAHKLSEQARIVTTTGEWIIQAIGKCGWREQMEEEVWILRKMRRLGALAVVLMGEE